MASPQKIQDERSLIKIFLISYSRSKSKTQIILFLSKTRYSKASFQSRSETNPIQHAKKNDYRFERQSSLVKRSCTYKENGHFHENITSVSETNFNLNVKFYLYPFDLFIVVHYHPGFCEFSREALPGVFSALNTK